MPAAFIDRTYSLKDGSSKHLWKVGKLVLKGRRSLVEDSLLLTRHYGLQFVIVILKDKDCLTSI
jgi:hypothetical protein